MIGYKLIYYNAFIFLLLIIAISCKKEVANKVPVINIESPSANQQFSTLDSIWIQASISDDNPVTSVKITITDQNFTSVQQPRYEFPNSREVDIMMHYPINESISESGDYYLLIRAEDGSQFKNAYQPIHISVLPTQLKRAIVITQKNNNLMELYGFSLSSDPNLITGIDGDFTASAINSAGGQMYISGASKLNLLAFNLNENKIDWQIEQVPLQPMHNAGCLFFDGLIYTTYFTDYIYGYSQTGAIDFNSNVAETESPAIIWKEDNYILADFQRTNSGPTYIKTIYATTGAEKQRFFTNYKIVGFHSQENTSVLITANENQTGKVVLYYIAENVTSTIDISAGFIHCSVSLENGKVLIGSDEGIFLYDPSLMYLIKIDSQNDISHISFDNLSSQLYLVSNNEVVIKSWPQMENQKTFTFSDPILDLHLQFTK